MLFLFLLKFENMIPIDQRINKKFILDNITEADIFCKYLNIDYTYIGTNKMFCNILRNDPNPTCTIKIFPDGKLWFRDWAQTKGYDCFGLIQSITPDCNFNQVLQIIAKHFSLLDGNEFTEYQYILSKEQLIKLTQEKSKLDIKIKRTEWTKKHYDFWKQFNLTTKDDLANIHPIKCYWYNDMKFQSDKIMFAYHFGDYNYKIYIPFASKDKGELKFLHNNSEILQGEHELQYNQDLLILQSSYKDVKVLRKIEKEYTFGFEVAATMSETIKPTKKKIEFLKTKYKNIILWYNNDKAGIEAMKQQSKDLGVDYIVHDLDLPKDISDIVKEINYEKAIEVTHNLIYG
jgi:hypothetical protein